MTTENRLQTRRQLLKKSMLAAGVTILPSSVALGKTAGNKSVSPSDKVNVALVGCGGKGERNRLALLKSGICNIVGLCDVDIETKRTEEARKAHPKAATFADFRVMLDKIGDQIDAVVVSTPDHSHFSAGMLAMSMGKHVWVEKPLAHTFGQIQRMIDLAERSGVVTQMGNQGHSGENYYQFKAWSEAGVFKDVTRIVAHMNKWRRWHGWGAEVTAYPEEKMPETLDWDLWCNASPVNPYSRKLHPGNWRCWYDYGSGAFGDWGPHILDTCHRFLKLGLPEKVTAVKREGANKFVFPQASTIEFSFPARGDMPPCKVTWYDGTKNLPELEPQFRSEKMDEQLSKVPGKIVYAGDHTFQGGSHNRPLKMIAAGDSIDEADLTEALAALPKYQKPESDHWTNFLRACKGEEEAKSPFSVSGPLSQVFSLGIIAQRLGGEVAFDRDSNSIQGNEAAKALLDPAPRKQWQEFYNL